MAEISEETHILENKWVISEQYQMDDKQVKNHGYEDSFEKICSFNSVEEFWGYWNKLPAISDVFFDGNEKIVIRTDARYPDEAPRKYKIQGQYLFKEGIEPKYEDEQNKNGGHLRLSINKDDHDKLSQFWETIVLGLIGETLDDADNITGARVVDKSNPYKKQIGHRIEIWFRDWNNEEFKTNLQKQVEKLMEECNMVSKEMSFYQNDFSKWQK